MSEMVERVARAAIYAMRVPTPSMVVSGSKEIPDPVNYGSSTEENAADCWQAMIDAALK